jgi:hypothetical protein
MPETHADTDELSMDKLNEVSGGDDKPATTLGGIAGRHGVAITNGGNNRNIAVGAFSIGLAPLGSFGGLWLRCLVTLSHSALTFRFAKRDSETPSCSNREWYLSARKHPTAGRICTASDQQQHPTHPW